MTMSHEGHHGSLFVGGLTHPRMSLRVFWGYRQVSPEKKGKKYMDKRYYLVSVFIARTADSINMSSCASDMWMSF